MCGKTRQEQCVRLRDTHSWRRASCVPWRRRPVTFCWVGCVCVSIYMCVGVCACTHGSSVIRKASRAHVRYIWKDVCAQLPIQSRAVPNPIHPSIDPRTFSMNSFGAAHLALPDHGDDRRGGHVLNQLGEEGLVLQSRVVLLLPVERACVRIDRVCGGASDEVSGSIEVGVHRHHGMSIGSSVASAMRTLFAVVVPSLTHTRTHLEEGSGRLHKLEGHQLVPALLCSIGMLHRRLVN